MHPPMNRKRWIIFAVLAIVPIALVLGYYVLFPRLVKIAVKHTLAGAGVEYVTLDVSNASPWRAHLANITVGRDGVPIEIKNVGLYYTPQELFAGNLNAIVLKGVTVSVTVKDGKVDLGPITTILQRRARAATREAKPAPTTSATLPVDHIALRDSTLLINTPKGPLTWPMNAQLLVNRDNKYALNLTLRTLAEFTISGTIDPNGEVIDLTARGQKIRAELLGQILEGLIQKPLPLSGTFDGDSHLHWQNGAGTLSATIKPNDLAYANLGPASGVLKVDTTLGGPAPAAKLAISDAQVQAAEIKADGVNANLAFSSLSPIASAPAQLIKIDKMSIGQVNMTNGTIQFEMKSPQSLRIETTHWDVFGGSFSAQPFEFNPTDPRVHVTLSVSNIDVKQLLDVFGQGKVTGSGKLTGQLPLTITPGDVQLGRGALLATQNGQIVVKDLGVLAASLGQAAANEKNPSSADQVRKNIIDALSDFQYDQLKADLEEGPDGKLVANVHLGGKGRTGAQQALSINLHIRGIEDMLRVVLQLRSRLNAAATRRTSS